jgi:hypothetical protein
MKRLALLLIAALSLTGMACAQPAGPTPASPPNLPPGASPASAPHAGTNPISPEEWKELIAARSAAFKADPDLVAGSQSLSEKMRAFDEKLTAAMVKTDPTIAPILAKFEAMRHPPGAPMIRPAVGAPPATPPPPGGAPPSTSPPTK